MNKKAEGNGDENEVTEYRSYLSSTHPTPLRPGDKKNVFVTDEGHFQHAGGKFRAYELLIKGEAIDTVKAQRFYME